MANQNILTNGAKVSQIEQVVFSPVAVVPPYVETPISTTYCFLAKVEPWDDENNPPMPTQDVASIKKIYKNIFVAKQIHSNDISPVIARVDWKTGTIYDYYRDDIDLLSQDVNNNNIYNYYVKNKFDQVFKCLWNKNGAASLNEPFFEPGSYGTNNIFTGLDGYKWKYIYTIDTGSKVKFMDSTWMPIPPLSNTPANPILTSAGAGSLDVINVLNGGSNYDTANAIVTVTITGDGAGATATANVSGGQIADIIVTSPGSNYTFANVAITSALGTGAVAIAPTSPIGGHAYDPISELGCSHVMFTAEFNGTEGGIIPTDIDYHQLGMVINPTTSSSSQGAISGAANGAIYSTTTDFIVAPGFGGYTNDEVIFQGITVDNATFTGRVLNFDATNNVIRVLNIVGTPSLNAPIFGDTSKTTRTLITFTPPNFTIFSGYLSFIENRTGVQRSTDGIEQVKFVLGY
jgi:hypothetical protein